MKKFLSFFMLLCLAVCATVLSVGCNPGYQPEGDLWFKYGDMYRVLERDGESQHLQDCALSSFFPPATSLNGISVQVNVDYIFPESSMFFKSSGLVTKEGALSIRKNLGLVNIEQDNAMFPCLCTGYYTYDKPITLSEVSFNWDLSGEPAFTVVGIVADLDVYKFNFTDYDSDGNQVGSGQFEAYVCTHQRVDKFRVYE